MVCILGIQSLEMYLARYKMKFYFTKIQKRILFMSMVVILLFVSNIQTTKAQQSQNTVPIGTGFDFQSIMNYNKNFKYDKIAYTIAKQILHQMTVSVVNWINSGFKGSPAFLTNPEGFFLDVGDQLTGQFISNSGPLARLCSPINLDLRLQLALNQSEFVDQRYSCTLSTVIGNVKRARVQTGIDISSRQGGATIGDMISGDILTNPNQLSLGAGGTSLDAEGRFLSGNFDEAGWQGFLALALEPQNNYYGAYMLAQNDLQTQIAQKQAAINADLNRGNGFLSWQKCDDVTSQFSLSASDPKGEGGAAGNSYGLNTDQINQLNAGGPQAVKLPAGSSIQKKIDVKTGKTTFEKCETETPGSVISNTLKKQLDVPATELELADNINAVVNALVSQMISKMLGGGLRSLSPNGSSNGESFTNQVIREEIINPPYTGAQIAKLNSDIETAKKSANDYKSIYDQSIGLMTDTKTRFETAQACFVTLNNNPMAIYTIKQRAVDGIVNIESKIKNVIDPKLKELASQQRYANSTIDKINQVQADVAGQTANNSTKLSAQDYSETYTTIIESTINSNNSVATAQKALDELKKTITELNAEAKRLQDECYQLSYNADKQNR
jgi:hypothetical protein